MIEELSRTNKEINPGLYVHVPFCISKCNYCDFFSLERNKNYVSMYLTGLKNELQVYHDFLEENLSFDTVYIGGGTPTSLDHPDLEKFFGLIFDKVEIKADAEITIEANPCTLDNEKLDLIRSYSNRISLGMQSSHDHYLELLGRGHDFEDFLYTYEMVVKYYPNINLDLIYGIPGETITEAEKDISALLDLYPPHISLYCLTLEEGTRLHYLVENGLIEEKISDELKAEMYYMARDTLMDNGYEHYEISNFSLPGYSAKHNIIYWRRGSYLGIGPGGHSFWNNQRWHNPQDLDLYLSKSRSSLRKKQNFLRENIQELDFNEAVFEEFFLGLRLTEGIDLKKLSSKYDLDLYDLFNDKIKKLEKKGLLSVDKNTVKLTPKGYMLANQVFIEFLESLDK